MTSEKIAALLEAMLAPKAGERMLILADYRDGKPDKAEQGRRELVLRWQRAAAA